MDQTCQSIGAIAAGIPYSRTHSNKWRMTAFATHSLSLLLPTVPFRVVDSTCKTSPTRSQQWAQVRRELRSYERSSIIPCSLKLTWPRHGQRCLNSVQEQHHNSYSLLTVFQNQWRLTVTMQCNCKKSDA